MLRQMMKSKIHRATVTGADLNYEGSIAICPALCKAADLLPNEKVDIYNCSNGARLSTYVIAGAPGQVMLNGAAARHAHLGDSIIIVAYALLTDTELKGFQPKVVFVDDHNLIKAERCKQPYQNATVI